MKKILAVFVIWKSLLIVIAGLSAYFIIPKADFLGKGFAVNEIGSRLWYWANFDGEHYLWIAENGYRQYENAFFPLYPIFIKAFSFFSSDVLTLGYLFSFVCSIGFVVVLYKLFRLDFSETVVLKGIVLLLVFPTAFYFNAVYTESLFLLLTVSSVYCARKKMYYLASLLAILAGTTRLVGVLLLPVLFIIWYKQSKRLSDLLPILLTPLGLGLVMSFNYYLTGDFLSFYHVQPQFGANRSGSGVVLFPQVIFRYIKILLTANPMSYNFFVAVQELLLTLWAFTILIWQYRKLKLEYLLFSLGVLLIPTLSGTLSSMPRYALAAFPIFIVYSLGIKNKTLFIVSCLLFAALQVINISLFVNGYWIS